MMKISSSPPSHRDGLELNYEERYVEVPAACISDSRRANTAQFLRSSDVFHQVAIPLVAVALDQPFTASGNGVVSQREANHVGFNGLTFRSANG